MIYATKFLAIYDFPYVDNIDEFAIAYHIRRFVLRASDEAILCHEAKLHQFLEVLKDLLQGKQYVCLYVRTLLKGSRVIQQTSVLPTLKAFWHTFEEPQSHCQCYNCTMDGLLPISFHIQEWRRDIAGPFLRNHAIGSLASASSTNVAHGTSSALES